jgi:hypothetical protein
LLYGISPTESNAEAIQYAFEFILSDALSDDEKTNIIIVTSYIKKNNKGDDATDDVSYDDDVYSRRQDDAKDDTNNDADDVDHRVKYVEVSIQAWSSSPDVARKVCMRV